MDAPPSPSSRERPPLLTLVLGAVLSLLLGGAECDRPLSPDPEVEHAPPIGGVFEVGLDGAARYTIPLDLPPGPAGMVPELALAYHSRSGSGRLGVGWSLSGLSVIARCAATLAQDGTQRPVRDELDDGLCWDGRRLVPVRGESGAEGTEYRIEEDRHARVISYGRLGGGPERFRVWLKSGRILDYGLEEAARVPGADGRTVREWHLSQVSDRSGNRFTVEHALERGVDEVTGVPEVRHRPLALHYGGPSGSRSVRFGYQDRTDLLSGYASGLLRSEGSLLSTVTMEIGGEAVWQYRLGYSTSSGTERRLLSRVGRCVPDGSRGWLCSPSTRLRYSPGEAAARTSLPLDARCVRSIVGDYNGDGLSDVLCLRTFLPETGVTGDGPDRLLLSTGDPADPFRITTLRLYALDGRAHLYQTLDQVFLPVDLDEDGDTDLLDGHYGSRALIAEGGSFTPLLLDASMGSWPGSVRVTDLDGDGRPEVLGYREGEGWVLYRPAVGPDGRMDPYLPWEREVLDVPVSADERIWAPRAEQNLLLLDHDGDCRSELLRLDRRSREYLAFEYDEHSWGPTGLRRLENPGRGPTWAAEEALAPMDLNGDGLADVLSVDIPHQRLALWLNLGGRFERVELGALPLDARRLQDFVAGGFDENRDGRSDLLGIDPETGRYQVLRSVGTGFRPVELGIGASRLHSGSEPYHFFLDQDGDGATDLLFYDRDMRLHLLSSRAPGSGSGAEPARGDLLVEIREDGARMERSFGPGGEALPIPPTVRIAYLPSTDPRVHTPAAVDSAACAYPRRCTRAPITVVREVERDAGLLADGTARRSVYRYEGASFDALGRGFLGFAARVESQPQRATEIRVEMDPLTRDEATGAYPFAGRPALIRSETELERGRLHRSTTQTVYRQRRTLGGAYFVAAGFRSEVVEEQLEAGGPFETVARSEATFSHDDHGSLRWALRSDGAGFSELEEHLVEHREGDWLLGLVTRSEHHATSPEGTTHSTHRAIERSFDALGRLETEVLDPEDPLHRLQIHYEDRDALGQPRQIRAVGSGETRIERIERDPEGLFVTRSVNALGHESRFDHDPATGQITWQRDPNGREVRTELDPFGRPVRLLEPEGETRFIWERVPHEVRAEGHRAELLRLRVQAPDGQVRSTFFDRLGRPVSAEHLGAGGQPLAEARRYDLWGRPTWSSLVHGAEARLLPGLTSRAATQGFDRLGRLVRAEEPDPEGWPVGPVTRIRHLGRTTEITDARGFVHERERDLGGRLIRSADAIGTASTEAHCWEASCGATTRYEHGPLGEVQRVIGPLGELRELYTDAHGRPERVADPTTGPEERFFDAFGRLVTLDRAGEVTTFGYDVLDRLLWRTSPEGTDHFEYDLPRSPGSAERALGLLSRSLAADGTEQRFEYDAMRRPSRLIQTAEGETAAIGLRYDGLSRLRAIDYPEVNGRPFSVRFERGVAGHLQEVRREGSAEVYWRHLEADAYGRRTRERYGDGTLRQRRYHEDDRLAELSVRSPMALDYRRRSGGSRALFDQRLSFDPTGNLLTREDRVAGRSERFVYDELDRLRQVQEAAGGISFEADYDAAGNLLRRTGVEETHFDPARPGLPAEVAGLPVAHDDQGRVIGRGDLLIEPTPFDLPRRLVPVNGDPVELRYAASGERALKIHGSARTFTLAGLYERRTDSLTGEVEHLFTLPGPEGPIAQRSVLEGAPGERLRYLHADPLGSVALVTDARGRVESRRRYGPFGRLLEEDGSAPGLSLGFGGHEEDAEADLVNFGGRIYDPVIGRFLSPDPIVAGGLISQALNPYSYVQNNPLTYNDPSGFVPEDPLSADPSLFLNFDPATEPDGWVFSNRPGSHGSSEGEGEDHSDRGDGAAVADRPSQERGATERRYSSGPSRAFVRAQARDHVLAQTGADLATLGLGSAMEEARRIVRERDSVGAAMHAVRMTPFGQMALAVPDGLGILQDVRTAMDDEADDTERGAAQGRLLSRALGIAAVVVGGIAGSGPRSPRSGSYSQLRRLRVRDAHHIIQDAAVRDLPGYSRSAAPAIELPGPPNRAGTPHQIATQVQRSVRGGGTYAAERRIGYRALRRAGLSPQDARAAILGADDYFRSIGVGPTTRTRIPGNRRR